MLHAPRPSSLRAGSARPRTARRTAFGLLGAVGLCGAVLASSACSDAPVRTVGAYCEQVGLDLPALVAPAIASADDVTATIDRYTAIARVAPAAIEPEWQVLIGALATAATVVPSDTESLTAATDAALASTPAAVRVQQYTLEMCGLEIGVPPSPTYPVTVTTVSPATTLPAAGG